MALSQVFLEYARGLGDSGPTVAALNNLSRLLAEQGRREEARTASERALELGQEQVDRHRVAALHTTWPTSFWRSTPRFTCGASQGVGPTLRWCGLRGADSTGDPGARRVVIA